MGGGVIGRTDPISNEAAGRAPKRRRSVAAPARFLDPIMALIERIDRRRRGIHSVRARAVLGLELRRHRGRPVTLADGAAVRSGDLVGSLHFDNVRMRELTAGGSLGPAWTQGRGDLAALAEWSASRDRSVRPVAYWGEGLHGAFAARVGFELRPRGRTPFRRLQDWYFRGLMARWSRQGWRRLGVGRHELHASEYWISAARLEAIHSRARNTD